MDSTLTATSCFFEGQQLGHLFIDGTFLGFGCFEVAHFGALKIIMVSMR